MILLNNINKTYEGEGGPVHALRGVNLSIAEGERVVIIGKSGSGKSTLLNVISGIDRPTSGEVSVKGMNLSDFSEGALARWRGTMIGIVFQFYQLLPTLTSLDNVLFAMDLVKKIPRRERREKAMALLREVGLGQKLTKFPNELSGGERQRVAIARSLANDPSVIIADEPTGNLDSTTGAQIDELFAHLNTKGTTVITVTHAALQEEGYDQVIRIEDGRLHSERRSQKAAVA